MSDGVVSWPERTVHYYQIVEYDNDYLRFGKAESNGSAVGRVEIIEIIGNVLEDTSR